MSLQSILGKFIRTKNKDKEQGQRTRTKNKDKEQGQRTRTKNKDKEHMFVCVK